MGRPKKTQPIIIHRIAQESVAAQKRAKRTVVLRPVRFFELLITNKDYSLESHVFDEYGTEFVATTKRGGENKWQNNSKKETE